MNDETEIRIIEAQYSAMKRGGLAMWTIYDHPSDFPHSYVARRFEVRHGDAVPTRDIVQSDSLQAIRRSFRICGLHCLTRNEEDDPKIVETWL